MIKSNINFFVILSIVLLFVICSCKKDEPIQTATKPYYIGQHFGGGVIFHLWKDSKGIEHGLIVDKTELSTSQIWSNLENLLIGALAQSSWNGLNNSNAIVGQSGHLNSAAALCLNSTNGGFNDWYLPALDEMSLLWQNRFDVYKTLNTINGATILSNSEGYWCSTETDANTAWSFSFLLYGESPYPLSKITSRYVRAIRAF